MGNRTKAASARAHVPQGVIALREVFLEHGLDPDRIKRFIEANLQSSREVNDLGPHNDEYYRNQLCIHEAEILKLMLEEEEEN